MEYGIDLGTSVAVTPTLQISTISVSSFKFVSLRLFSVPFSFKKKEQGGKQVAFGANAISPG